MSDHTSIVEHMNEILTPWKPAWNTDPMPRGTADEIIWTGTPSKSRGARRRSLRPRARDCRPSGSAAPPGHDRLGQSRPQAPPPPAEEEVIAKLSEHGQRRSPRQGRSSLPRLLWQAAITGGVSNIWCGKRRLAWSRRPLRHARRFRRSQCRPAPNRVALPQASSPSHALSSRTTPEPNKRSASRKAPRGAPGFSDKRRYAISL